ncbi:MAG: hypothetical protein AAB726_03395 [Patescibacteria group bacterium]
MDENLQNGEEVASAVPAYRAPGNIKTQELQRILGRVREIFNDKGENFEDGDEELIVEDPPEEPNFPYLMLMAAILKDVLDSLDLSIVGIILTTIFSFIFAITMFIWCLGKLKGRFWKKYIIRWLWKRYVVVIIIEFIPFFKIFPIATIFVLMAHHHEKKIVRLFNLALEELRGAGILKYIK